MNFFGQTRRNSIPILGFLLVLFSASCSSLAPPEPKITQVTPLPESAQPVEYGASLSEWEEATQADTEQTANRDQTVTEAAVLQVTVPTAAIASDEVASPVEANDVAPTEETVTEAAVLQVTVPTAAIASDEVASPAEANDVAPTEETIITEEITLITVNDVAYQEVGWEGLVPADFTSDAIMAKYEEQLAQLEDGSAKASALYTEMQEEFNSAPVNEVLNKTLVRLPGFIAPLEYTDDLITEFLLVPYFGACIHVPPPPTNQTVLVKTGEGHGIKSEDSYKPVWVMGKLTTKGSTTELAEAGYYMQDAIIEPYTSP